MTTGINFLASIQTSRYRSLTMDGWLSLSFSARTEKWLGTHPLARFTKA